MYPLTIIGNYVGGTQLGTSFGGGNIQDIFRAAADIWESVILDDFTVVFDYGWGPNPGAYHWLIEQGGEPNREIHGGIWVNPQMCGVDQYCVLFMDSTPYESEEFTEYAESSQDFGTGLINTERSYMDRNFGVVYQDLLYIFLHEIGHGLGMSHGNVSFVAERADGFVDITSPLPYAGASIPLAANDYEVVSHLNILGHSVMAGCQANTRCLPTVADILALAQLSGFRQLNLGGGHPTTQIIVGTNPVGRVYKVDGVEYADQQNFSWIVGSTHEISVAESQGSEDTRYIFANWNDGGDSSHSITAPADSSVFIATFIPQFKVTTTVSPKHCGFIDINPESPDGYYDVGTTIKISATTEDLCTFSAWDEDLSGTLNPQYVRVSEPLYISAIFQMAGSRPARLSNTRSNRSRIIRQPARPKTRSVAAPSR
ncbi:MAG: hypothetical protein QUT30_12250 [Acidobacteriota bacterium]|nr:hypothetical protein [Acidobacteriota bacterium]